MSTLLEIWENTGIAHPFIAQDDVGNLFLCQTIINNSYFLGLRIEIDPFDPRTYRFVRTIVAPGNLSIWEVV